MENDRSLKVDVAMNGYRDENGKYNLLSYDVDTPRGQGFKEEFDSSVAIVAGVNQDGKVVLISEAALEKNQLSRDMLVPMDTKSDNSKPIEVKDIEDVLKGDMPDDTIIKTPKGIELTAGQIREETRNFKYEDSPLASNVKSKRVEAIEFLTKKDKNKHDFKIVLRDCLKGVDNNLKNEIIRSIYKIKVLNKSFKHLNINSKRIALNNYLSDKFIEHSAMKNESTMDLLSMLKNDKNIIDYVVLLKKVIVVAINRKIKLH